MILIHQAIKDFLIQTEKNIDLEGIFSSHNIRMRNLQLSVYLYFRSLSFASIIL